VITQSAVTATLVARMPIVLFFMARLQAAMQLRHQQLL
jgi:hypothetical protein